MFLLSLARKLVVNLSATLLNKSSAGAKKEGPPLIIDDLSQLPPFEESAHYMCESCGLGMDDEAYFNNNCCEVADDDNLADDDSSFDSYAEYMELLAGWYGYNSYAEMQKDIDQHNMQAGSRVEDLEEEL